MDGYLTQNGANLIAKLNTTHDSLEIAGILGGNGSKPSVPYSEMEDISARDLIFKVYKPLQYVDNAKLNFSLYYVNDALTEPYTLTEIGIFAQDPDKGTILLAVIPLYDFPQAISANASVQGGIRFELTSSVEIELKLAPSVTIIINESMVFLTLEQALNIFYAKGDKISHTEIIINGDNHYTDFSEYIQYTEERITILEKANESGSTGGISRTVLPPEWIIVNGNGYYNAELNIYEA